MSHNGDYWATSNSSISDGPLEKLCGVGDFRAAWFFSVNNSPLGIF